MFQFADPEKAYLFFLLPAVLSLLLYGRYRKRRLLQRFADAALLPRLSTQFSPVKEWLRIALIAGSLVFLVLTLMRPQGNPVSRTVTKQGRDLVFVLDVSRSMLAEDLKPNRLGKAKLMIADMLATLKGDRVGLLVFAGQTVVKCPLTLDYHYFRNILDRVSPDDVNRGGTLIGDAIRVVSERLFYDQDNRYRDIILITDGDDHESFPVEAAKTAAERGTKIHTVGLGDPEGANIPLRADGTYQLLKYGDEIVKTRLDESSLRQIAAVTRGVFIPARTRLVDLAALYHDTIATADQREGESQSAMVWRELFQFFLGIAMLLLMVETLLGERKMGL